MKYYVVADIHGFFDALITALDQNGFFNDTEPHKLIICGDLFDRGKQAFELQEFVLNLLAKDEVILIRGNHEDLAVEMMDTWSRESYTYDSHKKNGTLDTMFQVSKTTPDDLKEKPDMVREKFLQSPYISKIIPVMKNYYETEHYIFVHGWIPCNILRLSSVHTEYIYIDNWRNVSEDAWSNSRWINGMEAAHNGLVEPGKTIFCGHWHASFGHARYEGRGEEFKNPDFSPYIADGIIAIDACTAFSKKANCVVVDD